MKHKGAFGKQLGGPARKVGGVSTRVVVHAKRERTANEAGAYATVRWKKLSGQARNQTPFCWNCKASDPDQLIVDHIRELADGGRLYDPDNLQVLCRRCHAQKTTAAKRARMVGRVSTWTAKAYPPAPPVTIAKPVTALPDNPAPDDPAPDTLTAAPQAGNESKTAATARAAEQPKRSKRSPSSSTPTPRTTV